MLKELLEIFVVPGSKIIQNHKNCVAVTRINKFVERRRTNNKTLVYMYMANYIMSETLINFLHIQKHIFISEQYST